MRCVVCEGPVLAGQEHYGNAWERVRKKLPCCTATCAAAFDDDLHWIPPELPPVATGDAQVELRHLASVRLRRLDEARGVVREMLGAGIAPAELRKLVAFNAEATAAEQRVATKRSLVGIFSPLLATLVGGRTRTRSRGGMHEAVDQRSAKSYRDALADLDRWEAVVAARAARR